MKIKFKIKKFLVAVSLLSILIQSAGSSFYALKVSADDMTVAQAINQNSSASSVTPSPTPQESQPDSISSTITPEESPTPPSQPVYLSPTPMIDESTSSSAQSQDNSKISPSSEDSSSSGNKSPPSENPLPSPSPEALSTTQGPRGKESLSAVVLTGDPLSADTFSLENSVSKKSAQLSTDKADYTPTEVVVVTGKDFRPETSYNLIITSSDDPAVNFQAEVKSDESGGFFYIYQLDGIYRPNYRVELKDDGGKVVEQTTFTDAALKLYTDASHTNEGYQFASGNTVFAQATGLNTNRGYKFDVKDLDGSVISGTTTDCITGDAIPGNNFVTTAVSDNRNFTFELHEWDSNSCSGSEKGGSPTTKTFNVAAATAYTSSDLTTPTTTYAVGSTAYVLVNGLWPNKNDWSTTWIKPDSATACANTGSGDRPDSSSSNGALPDASPAYLEYTPTTGSNNWNDPAKYNGVCPAFSESNAGDWKLTLTKDSTHAVTFSVFTVNLPDTTPPVSSFSSPSNDDVWKDPIYISGSSTDVPDTTVAVVNVYARFSGSVDWGDPILNFEGNGDDPFYWANYCEPDEDGTYDLKVSAIDDSGNIEESDYVYNIIYDTTSPESNIDYPVDEVTYTEESWNEDGEIRGTANDDGSGVSTVYVSIQNDSDGTYWCDQNECGDGYGWYDESEGETLNEAELGLDSGSGPSWTYGEIDFSDLASESGVEGYTIVSHAEDSAGNLEETSEVHFYILNDTTAPVSTIDSPGEGSFWNSPIEISGSSTDEPETTVDYVNFYYRASGGEEDLWIEIPDSQQENEDEVDPYEWSFNWIPLEDGAYDIKAEATDKAGNVEESPTVIGIIFDTTAPETPSADPAAGDYTSDQSVTLSSSDSLSGVDNIFYTTDGTDPSDTNGTEYSDPIAVGVDTTIKAIAYDNAGNFGDILTAEYGIAPVISDEASSSVTDTSVTITWTTDDPATSRVLYDTVSHEVLGSAPNYGYAGSTIETDTSPKVTSHSVFLTGLLAGTTYFYRTVSHGSPEAVGDEKSVKTEGPAVATATSGGGGGGAGGGDGKSDGLGCAVKDCSGKTVQLSQVFIAPSAVQQRQILGEATPEAELSERPTGGVLGEEENASQKEPIIKINAGFGWKKITASLVLLAFVIFLLWFFLRRRREKENPRKV